MPIDETVRKCSNYLSQASVAQLVEQHIRNVQVAGSSPAGSSIKVAALRKLFRCSHFL